MLVYGLTGGTGTLGTALTLRLLSDGHRVRAIARGEAGHERLEAAVPFEHRARLSSIVADVRDRGRIRMALDGCDVVIHAAAMKRIPLCEYNPQESVATNVDGTRNVAEAVVDLDVSRACFISSDKARAPVTHYGSCKLAAERLWLGSNVLRGSRPHPFFGVAYGNVFGSAGSILHTFRAQARTGGPVKLTDSRCTRFNITLSQAVDFVLAACRDAEPGTLWIPRLPSYRVTDFARAVAPAVETVVTGLRANEKVHEVLVSEDEARSTRAVNGHYEMRPGHCYDDHVSEYHSGRNPWFLGVDELRNLAEATT